MPDKKIECKDCGNEFTFTEGEQQFFQDKFGDDYVPPKRCKACRKTRKSEKNNREHNHRQ